jgi:hypothetical protein
MGAVNLRVVGAIQVESLINQPHNMDRRLHAQALMRGACIDGIWLCMRIELRYDIGQYILDSRWKGGYEQ